MKGQRLICHQLSFTEFSADESRAVVLAAKFKFNEAVEYWTGQKGSLIRGENIHLSMRDSCKCLFIGKDKQKSEEYYSISMFF